MALKKALLDLTGCWLGHFSRPALGFFLKNVQGFGFRTLKFPNFSVCFPVLSKL